MKETAYINDIETSSQFRRKARISVITAICVLTLITAAAGVIGKYTDLICNTDFFDVRSENDIPIKAADSEYSGSFFSAAVTGFFVDPDNVTADIFISKYNGFELSPRDFILIKYDISGQNVETVFFPQSFEYNVSDGGTDVHLVYSDALDIINGENTVYCIRTDTHSDDGILNILCHINK